MAGSDPEALPAASRSTLSPARTGNFPLGSRDFNNLVSHHQSLCFATFSKFVISLLHHPTARTLWWFHGFFIWIKRRNNLQPKYPHLIENQLFHKSAFFKLLIPVASAFTMPLLSAYITADAGADTFKALMPRLITLALSSLLSMAMGGLLQPLFPEFSVFAMLASQTLGYTSIFTVILVILPDYIFLRLLVYLSIIICCSVLVSVVVQIFKEDVRKPQDDNSDIENQL